jgi:hypothetical protein
VRFELSTPAIMKMAAFWIVAPCSLVEVNRRFRGAHLHDGGNKCPTRRQCNNPEKSHLQYVSSCLQVCKVLPKSLGLSSFYYFCLLFVLCFVCWRCDSVIPQTVVEQSEEEMEQIFLLDANKQTIFMNEE